MGQGRKGAMAGRASAARTWPQRRRGRYRYPGTGRQRAGRDTWWGARSIVAGLARIPPGLSACGNGASDKRITWWGPPAPRVPAPGVAPPCQCHRLERTSLLAPLILPPSLSSHLPGHGGRRCCVPPSAAFRPVHSSCWWCACWRRGTQPHPAGGAGAGTLPCTARTAMPMLNAELCQCVRACVSERGAAQPSW